MMDCICLLSIITLLVCNISESVKLNRRLNDFITHYEVLDYDRDVIHEKHIRVKRWLQNYEDRYKEEPSVTLRFIAYNRRFHIKLMRDIETFSSNINLDVNTNFSIHDVSHLFIGHLDDVPGSYAYGSIIQGVFSGKIILPEETFYIERSTKYFPNLQNNTFHSIIYSERNLENPMNNLGQTHGCGVNSKTQDWMTKVMNSEIKTNNVFFDHNHDYINSDKSLNLIMKLEKVEDDILFLNKTNNINNKHSPLTISKRKKRDVQLDQIIQNKEKTTCTLHIRTDPMLWKEISKQKSTKEKTIIREEILAIIGHHVKAANDIFSNTLFKWNDEMYKNIRFVVQTVKIDSDDECDPDYNGTLNPFCAENIDVSNFLEIHSRVNHEAFCLSYAFTYRDFTGGVIGLAWVASTSASGGICQKQARYYDSTSSNMQRSLNTGIVTFLNYGRHLPSRLSELTFTHELGHNFGAPHDPEDCQPGGNQGNYVMYASSTNGYLSNNVEFSDCSIRSISEVLDQSFNSASRPNCFIATDGAFCGNQLVEDGEECDCGYDLDECHDNCCNARKTNEKAFPASTTSGSLSCKRKPHAACSPSEGPCCQAQTCQFSTKKDNNDIPCKKDSECSEESYCNGLSPNCPIPTFKPNNTECNKGSQVCIDGECRGSICLKYDLKECFLSSSEYNDKRELCKIACIDRNGFCKPTSELGVPDFQPNLSLRPGSPCDNFKGYCDVFQKCRAVDEKGPLLRLKRLLFNRRAYKGLWEWCLVNWWGVILIALGIILFMGLFIKCFAVHTPSSNPYMAKRVKLTQTLRKPINSLRKQPKPERSRAPEYTPADSGREEHIPMEPRYP